MQVNSPSLAVGAGDGLGILRAVAVDQVKDGGAQHAEDAHSQEARTRGGLQKVTGPRLLMPDISTPTPLPTSPHAHVSHNPHSPSPIILNRSPAPSISESRSMKCIKFFYSTNS